MHFLIDWLGSIVGTASVPALVAALAWKYREKLFALLEKVITDRLDKVAMNTEIGKRIIAIDEKLSASKLKVKDVKDITPLKS